MPTSSPKITGPLLEADNLVATTEALAAAYTAPSPTATKPWPAWKPQPPRNPDMASALIRVFAGMVGQLRDRVNRVPDRNFLAFLNLLGADPTPPRPSRLPLTFYLAGGSTVEPTVPARTRVGAQALPGDPGEVTFETTSDMVATRAQLAAVLVREVDNDSWTDASAIAAPGGAGYFDAFVGKQPMEHSLYLSADSILGLAANTSVTFTLTFASSDDLLKGWSTLTLTFAYSDGAGGWPALKPTSTQDTTSAAAPAMKIAFPLPAGIAPEAVNGVTARWIRAKVSGFQGSPSPLINRVVASAQLTGVQATLGKIFHGGAPVDTSMDFFPLGPQPAFNDTFYVQADDAFSRPGAKVTVTVTPSPAQKPPSSTDSAVLAWEVFDGTSWKALTPAQTIAAGTNPFQTVTLTLPQAVGLTTVNGQAGYWLRVRVTSGDFGKGTSYVQAYDNKGNPIVDAHNVPALVPFTDGYRPPIVKSIAIAYDHTPTAVVYDKGSPSQGIVRYDDLVYNTPTLGQPFQPFIRGDDFEPAVFLGFTQPFTASVPVTLFVDVEPRSPSAALPPASAPPTQVIWEYWSPAGWASLSAEDDTRSFAESGMVRFLGPADFTARVEFGQTRYWLRARLHGGTPDVLPRLGRVLVNTVWGTHTITLQGEELGGSDQTAGQSFTLTHAPVLAGEQIVVLEPTLPPSAEQDAIRAAEGPDAITVTTGSAGDEVWVRWHAVPDFYASGPHDRHYQIDRAGGVVSFGDGVRGMIPPRGTRNIRAAFYQTGGGAYGDRPVGSASQLKTTIAYVDSVTNHVAGSGGADAEGIDSMRERAPAVLRHGGRAVTAQDFEDLARLANPRVCKARAITPHFDPVAQQDVPTPIPDAGTVKVIIVPSSTDLRPTPGQGLLMDVQDYLVRYSAPGVAMRVTGPDWLVVNVLELKVIPVSLDVATTLPNTILAALIAFFHPLTGGVDGTGWDFGLVPHKSDILGVISKVPGVDSIRTLRFEIRYCAGTRPADYYDTPPLVPDTDTSSYDETVASVKAAERVLISSGTHKVSFPPDWHG